MMTVGALLVLETKTSSGVQPGAVAEVVDTTTSEHYSEFCDRLKKSNAVADFSEFVCVQFLHPRDRAANGFYLKKRFRFLDIKHNSKIAN